MSRHHRSLSSRRWAFVRRRALDRDAYRCRYCGRAGRLEVDHVRPLDWGGDPYALENLQTLCRGCHIAKTRAERSGWRKPPPPEVAAWRALVDRFQTPIR